MEETFARQWDSIDYKKNYENITFFLSFFFLISFKHIVNKKYC